MAGTTAHQGERPSLCHGALGPARGSRSVWADHEAAPDKQYLNEAFVRGDREASKAAQLKLNPVRMSLTLGTAPGGVKAALNLLGLPIGPCRSPVAPLSPEKLQKMRGALEG